MGTARRNNHYIVVVVVVAVSIVVATAHDIGMVIVVVVAVGVILLNIGVVVIVFRMEEVVVLPRFLFVVVVVVIVVIVHRASVVAPVVAVVVLSTGTGARASFVLLVAVAGADVMGGWKLPLQFHPRFRVGFGLSIPVGSGHTGRLPYTGSPAKFKPILCRDDMNRIQRFRLNQDSQSRSRTGREDRYR